MTDKNLKINDNDNDKAYSTFNSGLYMEPYFTKVDHLGEEIENNRESGRVEYNRGLFKVYYGVDEEGEEELNNDFWEKLSYWPVYFKPLEYNEEIAFECGLIPFKFKYSDKATELELLALGSCGMEQRAKFDAYQVVRHEVALRSCPPL